jgi:sporulation protein YlmC with PRC-barrel domain
VSARELRVEMLLGRPVIAANGHSVGRVEDIRAEVRGQGAVVTEVLIGPAAALERLSAHVTQLFGKRKGYVARPEQLDLSDPQHPRLRVSVEERAPLEGEKDSD